jgi:hypothetical protein
MAKNVAPPLLPRLGRAITALQASAKFHWQSEKVLLCQNELSMRWKLRGLKGVLVDSDGVLVPVRKWVLFQGNLTVWSWNTFEEALKYLFSMQSNFGAP